MDEDDRCPSCDSADEWQISRRHRFSPFGSVILVVLSFWFAVAEWFWGFGLMPAFVLLAAAVMVSLATRTAEICSSCGYVRRSRR